MGDALCRRLGRAAVSGGLLAGAMSLAAQACAAAALSFDAALQLAREQAPSLLAQRWAVDAASGALPAAAALPAARVALGLDNLPISGPDRFSLGRDFMTMQRLGLMQEVPNAAKRAARNAGAGARLAREQALLAGTELAVQREAGLAWLGLYFSERRVDLLLTLAPDSQILSQTVDARIAAGRALPAERVMAQQATLALADRLDDARRDVARARAALRRWLASRADDTLDGAPPAMPVSPEALRARLARHTEIAGLNALAAQANAEVQEARADQQGDWGWAVSYSRRGPAYSDMVSLQLSWDIPGLREHGPTALLNAKQSELARTEADRQEALRRLGEALDGQIADLQALDTQHDRLAGSGLSLADQRVALTLASYQAGRSELDAVLAARREAIESRLRLLDLDAQRAALRLRLNLGLPE